VRVVVLLLVAVCSLAHAGDSADVSQALAQIAKLESSLEYEQALVLADRTIARGISSRDQLADLHLIAGRLAAGLDHPEVAQEHFERVLVLRPNTQLVTGTSPKLLAPFDAARATQPALVVKLGVDGKRAYAEVTADTLQLVRGLRVVVVDANKVSSVVTGDGLTKDVPLGTVTSVAVTDEYGNELVVARIEAPAPIVPERRVERSTPFHKHWVTYTALSGAALITGGLFAWRFGLAQDEWNRLDAEGGHGFTQLQAVEQRGQRWAIAADATFGVAAIAGIVAAALFLTRDGEPSHVAFTGTGGVYTEHF
jgi:hypothetical protein